MSDLPIYSVLLLTSFCVCYGQTTCLQPRPGKCLSNNVTISSSKATGSVYGVNCGFVPSSGLCCYRQGCSDFSMSNWAVVVSSSGEAMAQVRQVGKGECDNESSVLESPWINFSMVSCLKLTYDKTSPADLEVLLERLGGDALPLTLAPSVGKSLASDGEHKQDLRSTVRPGTAKVIFRAFSEAGSGTGGDGVVNVHNISVETGGCTWSGNLNVTAVSGDVKQGVSSLLSPTEPDTVDCLSFTYVLSNDTTGNRLEVSVLPLNDSRAVTVWEDTVVAEGRKSGECSIQVRAPYKIIFQEDKSGSNPTHFTVEVSSLKRSVKSEACQLQPTGAGTSNYNIVVMPSVVRQQSGTQRCPDRSFYKMDKLTAINSTDETPSEKDREDEKNKLVAKIVAAVMAVLLLLAIFGAYIWWRLRGSLIIPVRPKGLKSFCTFRN